MVINLDLDLDLDTVEYIFAFMSRLHLAAKTYQEFQLFRRSIQEVLCRSRQYHMILDLELPHTHCGA